MTEKGGASLRRPTRAAVAQLVERRWELIAPSVCRRFESGQRLSGLRVVAEATAR